MKLLLHFTEFMNFKKTINKRKRKRFEKRIKFLFRCKNSVLKALKKFCSIIDKKKALKIVKGQNLSLSL